MGSGAPGSQGSASQHAAQRRRGRGSGRTDSTQRRALREAHAGTGVTLAETELGSMPAGVEEAGRAGPGGRGRQTGRSLTPHSPGQALQSGRKPRASLWSRSLSASVPALSPWPRTAGGGLGRLRGLAFRAGARSQPSRAPLLPGESGEEPCHGRHEGQERKKPGGP